MDEVYFSKKGHKTIKKNRQDNGGGSSSFVISILGQDNDDGCNEFKGINNFFNKVILSKALV